MTNLAGAVSLVDATAHPPAILRPIITVGRQPSKVAIAPDGHHAYVSDGDFRSVSVVDTITHSVTPIDIGCFSLGVVVNPDGRHAYVSGGSVTGPGTLSVIDTVTRVVSAIPLGLHITTSGNHGSGLALSRDGRRVYISGTSSVSGAIAVVDTASNTVIATIDAADTSFMGDVAVSADGGRVYLCDSGAVSVSVVDTSTGTVLERISLGDSRPLGMAVSPDGSRLYVTGTGGFGGNVSVIDTATNRIIATIATKVGDLPAAVAVSPRGHHAYVTNTGSTTMSVIDTHTNLVTTVPVGIDPVGVAVSPDGTRVYLSGSASSPVPGTVSVTDTGHTVDKSGR